jgi:hypothetical protein
MDKKKLIAEYERLRKLAHELDVQSNTVDARLVEIEKQLPTRYKYPGDRPLGSDLSAGEIFPT